MYVEESLALAKGDVAAAKGNVVAVEVKVAAAKKDVTAAEAKVTAAKHEVTAAEIKVTAAKQEGDKLMLDAAYHSLKCASEGQASAQAALTTAEMGVATAQTGVATAQAGVASAQTVLDACCNALAAVITRRMSDTSATSGAGTTSGASGTVAEVVATEPGQGPASSFTSSHDKSIDGVGMCFSSEWLRVDVADGAAAFRREFGVVDAPPDDEVARVADVLRACVMDTHSLRIVHETKTTAMSGTMRLVQNHHLDALCDALGADVCKTTTGESRLSLLDLKCSEGVANAKSSPDAYLMGRVVCHRDECSVFDADAAAATAAVSPADKDAACDCNLDALVVGIGEAKHTTDSAVEALRQAFVESTNVALAWRRRGVPCARVTVPVWATTGQLVKFGVTRMLEPAFPYLVIMSKTLDLADARDRTEAATLFASMMAWCRTPVHAWAREANTQQSLGLSTRAYHLKPLENVFLVADDGDASLAHMLHVLQRLQPPSPACAFVEAPITVRTGAKWRGSALVFRNLALDGYQIGVPSERAERERYLAAIRAAMEAIHEAGVVHLDFYPSNFMWKATSNAADGCDREHGPSGERMLIKIIDWDAAHVLGAPLTTLTHSRMATLADRVALVPNGRQELRAVAGWDTGLFDVLCAAAKDAAFHTQDKAALDDAFWRACRQAALQQSSGGAVQSRVVRDDSEDDDDGEDVCRELAALGVDQ
jgi:hypothetical protein